MKIKLPGKFNPRQVFPQLDSIPRSYFLGHHRAGLDKMKNMLSSIDYVIECRDFRVPVTSVNPMFEEALGKKSRLIVYTKRDLGGQSAAKMRKVRWRSLMLFVRFSKRQRSQVSALVSRLRRRFAPSILKHQFSLLPPPCPSR
jgi:mitochondrial GTPase 1